MSSSYTDDNDDGYTSDDEASDNDSSSNDASDRDGNSSTNDTNHPIHAKVASTTDGTDVASGFNSSPGKD
jgi:hypothetical protein